jgi:hypothetical protein
MERCICGAEGGARVSENNVQGSRHAGDLILLQCCLLRQSHGLCACKTYLLTFFVSLVADNAAPQTSDIEDLRQRMNYSATSLNTPLIMELGTALLCFILDRTPDTHKHTQTSSRTMRSYRTTRFATRRCASRSFIRLATSFYSRSVAASPPT